MTAGRKNSDNKKDWNTPPEIIESVKSVFGGTIYLDPCSNLSSLVNAKIEYVLPENDGLAENWNYPTIFVNPPYGADKERKTIIIDWFEKVHHAYNEGSEIIVLVPVATNTNHWKNHVFGVADAICFLSAPRLKFWNNGKIDNKGAPMACAVIYYGKNIDLFSSEFEKHGAIVRL